MHLAAFISACSTLKLDLREMKPLTHAMVPAGERLSWEADLVIDKHCIGGLPGNRTTPIVVAILASLGLTIPKTSSRAITSPAGTADTMETLTPSICDVGDPAGCRSRGRMPGLGRRRAAEPRRRRV